MGVIVTTYRNSVKASLDEFFARVRSLFSMMETGTRKNIATNCLAKLD